MAYDSFSPPNTCTSIQFPHTFYKKVHKNLSFSIYVDFKWSITHLIALKILRVTDVTLFLLYYKKHKEYFKYIWIFNEKSSIYEIV